MPSSSASSSSHITGSESKRLKKNDMIIHKPNNEINKGLGLITCFLCLLLFPTWRTIMLRQAITDK